MNLPKGFTYLTADELKDHNIIVDLRYLRNLNFVGEKITGYEANKVIMTDEAKEALFNASEKFNKEGYDLVIYDAYRPQKAVNHFKRWSDSKDLIVDKMKNEFFPYIDHDKAFELGYIAEKSGHSRGSTIDLTIIEHGRTLKEVKYQERILSDERVFIFLDDGTVDMGSHFDLFDEASHSQSTLVFEEASKNRNFFIETMESVGFKNYPSEWWHFTLENEPFLANALESYFDFDIK